MKETFNQMNKLFYKRKTVGNAETVIKSREIIILQNLNKETHIHLVSKK